MKRIADGFGGLIKDHDDSGPIRYMDADEIKERSELNIANTASAKRRAVVEELAKVNGHSRVRT